MKFAIVFFALCFYGSTLAQAPNITSVRSGADYPFVLYLPEDSILNNNPPVIVFLHGRSLSGTDLELVKKYGVIDAIERGRNIPAIVIAPQVKKGETWVPAKILSTLEYVQKKYTVDNNRIYVTGMSLGGYGTLFFAGAYPDKIAAAVALCGGGNTKDACNLAQTNVWIQHGKLDRAVPHSESTVMVNAIRACDSKANCIFTSYPNADHGDLADEFYKDTLYNWLFQYSLDNPSPEPALVGNPEVQAAFAGGETALGTFLQENFEYPQEAIFKDEQGRVVVTFVVETDGTLSNFEVKESVSPLLDGAALKLAQKMPAWISAKQKGENVRTVVEFPINFAIN